MTTAALEQRQRREHTLALVWALVKHHVLTVYSLLAFVYLMLPIGVVIAFSFNNPQGRFNYVWSGFTLDNWKNWDGVPGLRSALVLSIERYVVRPTGGRLRSKRLAITAGSAATVGLVSAFLALPAQPELSNITWAIGPGRASSLSLL